MKKALSIILSISMLFTAIPLMGIAVAADDTADYSKMDTETLERYMNEALALKEEIINSPTDVTYTGTAYYISETGNDSADGLTPETAWRSLDKVSGKSFLKPGDAVLFKRGDTFRYTETFMTKTGVTYSAYGTGAKPKMVGSIDASAKSFWKETEYEDVYEYVNPVVFKDQDIGVIVFDMGRAWGIKMTSGVDNGTISNGLETFQSGGYKLTNAGDLKNDLEYWLDRDKSVLYLKSVDGHPSERFSSIELADSGNAFSGEGTDVTVDNIAFFGFGSHGLGYGSVTNSDSEMFTVQYCTFDFIGGVTQDRSSNENTGRLGNAVEIYGSAKNFTIHHCYAQNVYDCCWTVQFQSNSNGKDIWFENVEMYNNVACYANTGLEIWLNNHDYFKNDATYGIKNMNLHDNYTFYNGYGWSQQRPNKDGNIFYGDPSETTTVYENNSIHDNVGMFASKWITYARYVGTSFYNFNNNVYFQHASKSVGGVPENPNNPAGGNPSTAKKYTKEVLDSLTANGFEPGTKFYYADDDYVVPEYEPEEVKFDDIKDHWGKDNIEATVMRGYFNGIEEGKFAPNMTMTRAMLATVLMRLYYTGGEIKDAGYTDVNNGAWYINAVNWAYTKGLVDENIKTFRPDDAITREEMADMLYRLTLSEMKTNDYSNASLTFKDAASVSPAYKAAIAFAVDNGIIAGYTDGSVLPKNTATRAEVATIMLRYVDKFAGYKIDYSNFTDKTDYHVFTADQISSMSSVTYLDKKVVNENGGTFLKLIPANVMNANPYLTIFEKFAKINFADYPFVKIRLKTTVAGNNSVRVNYYKDINGDPLSVPVDVGEWTSVVACVYDMLDIATVTANKDSNGQLSIYPSGDVRPTYNVDECLIEYVGFFPSKEAAEAYKGDFESNSKTVTFMHQNNVYESYTVLAGETLKYPESSPSMAGYTFDGWDVAEGTVINSDMTVNSVLTAKAGAPTAYFDVSNTTAKGGQFDVEVKEENGVKYYHFTPTMEQSADGTRCNILSDSTTTFDFAANHVMKFAYRTVASGSAGIDFNLCPASNRRIWGPRINYTTQGKWVEQTVDLYELNWIGGENVESTYTAKQYAEEYITGNGFSTLIFKPYIGNGVAIGSSDYFDIAYVAFFPSVDSAKLFNAGLAN